MADVAARECWPERVRPPRFQECDCFKAFRSEERIATEKRYLKRKWKAHIRLENYKSQDRVSMDAPRRQSVKV
jgi:hypothetical protein